nr:M56 family metallopeptidase [Micrococcus endophyticus]
MAVGAGAGIAVHLLLTTAVTAVRTLRARARHRDAVELVATGPADAGRWPGGARGARELPVDDPLAYCVPGSPRGGEALTVVSSGLLARLSPEELDAVVAHERAHLDQHHGLLRLAFAAWARACAWLPTAETARLAVVQVTEMLADDAALRRAPADVLVRALAQAAPGPDAGPAGQADATGPTSAGLGDRAARLLTRPAPLPAAAAALVAAASLALPAATAAALLGLP